MNNKYVKKRERRKSCLLQRLLLCCVQEHTMSFSNSLPGKCHSVNLCSCQLRRSMHKIRKMLLIKRLAFRVSCVHRMYHVCGDVTSTTAANDHDKKAKKKEKKNETTKIRKWKTPNDCIYKHRRKALSSTK